MSKTELEKERSDVFLDFNGVIKIFKDRGVAKTLGNISEETGNSLRTLDYQKKRAAPIVKMIFHFLKENDLKFEDLVKEVESKK